MIVSVLGHLDKSDLSFITDPEVAVALENDKTLGDKTNFKDRFPTAHDGMIAMLQSMLEFNPFFRKKPEEYLKSALFEPWRKKYPELLVPPSDIIELDVDQKHAFNYENSKFKNIDLDFWSPKLLKK